MGPLGLMLGAGVVSGLGGLFAGGMRAKASTRAAKAQADAAKYAIDEQRRQYDITRQDMQPYMQAGAGAIEQLGGQVSDPNSRLMRGFGVSPESQYGQATRPYGFDPYQKYGEIATRESGLPSLPEAYDAATREFEFDPESDPSYQFRLQQGLGALEGSQAAKGKFFSGETGKALLEHGQGFASQEYQKAYERDLRDRQLAAEQYSRLSGLDLAQRGFESGQYGQAMSTDMAQRGLSSDAYARAHGQNIAGRQLQYGMLSGVAGLGQSGAAQMGGAGAQMARDVGGYGMQGAQALGQGYMGAADAWGGAMQNVGNQLQGGMGMYTNYLMLQKAGLI